MQQEQAKQIIEALLFTSNRPLNIIQIKDVLEELDAQAIKSLLTQLKQEYADSGRSFTIKEVAGGYQIITDPAYAAWLKKLYRNWRTERLSHPSLETLAIIAYRQPITRLEIEDIRGVNVDGVLKTLLEKTLVRISGRKAIAGRPFLYGTSMKFLEFFGLQSLEELPKLEEFGELASIDHPQSLYKIDKNKEGEKDVRIKEIAQENRQD